ncbi:hypothetical protein PsYK624_167180 [Phanerochaete sordida]|uniref:Uncharacterized protein n=1 Tax=Phanerochaete sordida TaxID=48140 RepID=A0A9P3GXC7_9APHY|nr:hypothetical protein PsYK624_167180 [Phanerochaete sordida]
MEAEIKLQLAEEEDSAIEGSVAAGQTITVSALLIELLELEEQQSAAHPDPQAPERQQLFLPHQLSVEDLNMCAPGLIDIEDRLREGQMYDSLDKLRCQLHVRTRMMTFKARHVCHQGPNTKIRRRLDVNDTKIIQLAEKYQAAEPIIFGIFGILCALPCI